MSTKEPVFCKDCKFAIVDPNSEWSLRCLNPNVNSQDKWALASRARSRGTDCMSERGRTSWFATCGIKGEQWELSEREL